MCRAGEFGGNVQLIWFKLKATCSNPIEMVFAKLKTLFRKADERTVEASWHRVGTLLDTFTPDECQNYLGHAGYALR